ncbi:MAG: HAMP domain-containing sensor histidine kinase [Mucilaginibacter sp.]|uniref:sensor histidine kinase n=1 Tax=Mucilaginibacter sp. TaxID=1882438 RepID=UPI0031A22DA2
MSPIPPFFSRIREFVSGPPGAFPLTVRIFHSVLAISMAALAYNVPLNFAVGLPKIALASAVTLALVVYLFYLSRFGGRTTPARLVYCLLGTSLFVANFFLNSGIDGPTGYFFVLMLVVMVAIVPVSEYWYWVGSNVTLLAGLHLLQFMRPDLIPFTYQQRADRFIDMTSAYITVVVIVLACFYIIRKRYDSERLEAQQNAAKLRVLDAEKNKLFSIISHDLRSPLSLIQNYLEMLAEFDLSETERREIKAQLLQSTRGTLDMVNNVLYWSTSQMSGGEVKRAHLVLADLLSPQLQLFQAIAARKNIRLESVFAENTTILSSADMIQLIIRNLLNNAIKFTAPGGHIYLYASRNGSTCLLTIKDSGNGKPAALSENIFELSSGTVKGTANESGVGLGLVLCREYTMLLGGRIWFNCDEKSGTTFFVELPATN